MQLCALLRGDVSSASPWPRVMRRNSQSTRGGCERGASSGCERAACSLNLRAVRWGGCRQEQRGGIGSLMRTSPRKRRGTCVHVHIRGGAHMHACMAHTFESPRCAHTLESPRCAYACMCTHIGESEVVGGARRRESGARA